MMLSTETVAKDVPSQIVYPLTLFDGMYAEVGITMGWLVDGRIDVAKIHAALDRVIAKWPMLGGRLEQESKVSSLPRRIVTQCINRFSSIFCVCEYL